MSPKTEFFFYLAALVCFLVAALGEGWKFGSRGRRGLAARLVVLPLGLALWIFPLVYNTGKAAF